MHAIASSRSVPMVIIRSTSAAAARSITMSRCPARRGSVRWQCESIMAATTQAVRARKGLPAERFAGPIVANSILRPARIDVLVPQQDSSRHAPDVLETRLAQRLGELQRAPAALAVDHDLLAAMLIELVAELSHLLKWDQLGAGNMRDLIFVGKPAIDEVKRLALVEHRFH